MKKFALLCSCLLLLLSCGDGNTKFKDSLGRFTVAFPETPETFQDTISAPIGDLILYRFEVTLKNDDNLEYSVNYMDYPTSFVEGISKKDQYNLFLYSQESLINDPSITSTGILNLNILGYLGRQFKWNDSSTDELLKNQVYLVNNRLYILSVKTPLANNFNKKIDEFLESFELIDTDPNPNAEEVAEVKSRFTIDFPGPTETQELQSTHEEYGDLNSIFEVYQPKLKNDENVLYGLGTIAYTKDLTQMENFDLDVFYEKAIQSTLNSRQTTLISKKNITQNGLKGVETKESFRQGMAVITQRMFLDKDVMTSVQVISQPNNDDNEALRTFFNSLRPKENP
jgi:hypothetical protein